ncbi:hypothetical protein LNQ03_06120 [Klebsiella pneumoniae subsp. pneumoniae]|nr:hypothetical protein [Klebsiella pneumoniae subsp. pneumoniae]
MKWWRKPSIVRKRTKPRAEAAELEVDELKSQLADYQQALDVVSRPAPFSITRRCRRWSARRRCAICRDLTPESADEWLETFQAKEQEATEKCCRWNRK